MVSSSSEKIAARSTHTRCIVSIHNRPPFCFLLPPFPLSLTSFFLFLPPPAYSISCYGALFSSLFTCSILPHFLKRSGRERESVVLKTTKRRFENALQSVVLRFTGSMASQVQRLAALYLFRYRNLTNTRSAYYIYTHGYASEVCVMKLR